MTFMATAAEWVQDCYSTNYLGADDSGGARESANCDYRVFRGGSWLSRHSSLSPTLRSYAPRDYRDFHVGFRLVREISWIERFALDQPETDWNRLLPMAAYGCFGIAALLVILMIWLMRIASEGSSIRTGRQRYIQSLKRSLSVPKTHAASGKQ